MAILIVSAEGGVSKEVTLSKARTTLGRRPHNDVILDDLAVSGEHAAVQMEDRDIYYLEDLRSTNGTYVNGKVVKNHLLQSGDIIRMGKLKIEFLNEAASAASTSDSLRASIKVLSGAAAGRTMELTKAVTSIGKPGLAVAAISRQRSGFVVHCIDGTNPPTINGSVFGAQPVALKNGDLIELAGSKIEFVQT